MRDNFFSELVYFDKSQLSPAVISHLAEYCSSPAFTPEAVSHSSVAAAHVCQWLRALQSYIQKHGEIRPLIDRMNAVEQQRKQVDVIHWQITAILMRSVTITKNVTKISAFLSFCNKLCD